MVAVLKIPFYEICYRATENKPGRSVFLLKASQLRLQICKRGEENSDSELFEITRYSTSFLGATAIFQYWYFITKGEMRRKKEMIVTTFSSIFLFL